MESNDSSNDSDIPATEETRGLGSLPSRIALQSSSDSLLNLRGTQEKERETPRIFALSTSVFKSFQNEEFGNLELGTNEARRPERRVSITWAESPRMIKEWEDG